MPSLTEKCQPYFALMRLEKPVGFLLLLWPTLATLVLLGVQALKIWLVFVVGAFVMRAAGCVMNDIADREFDGAVARTKRRPLAVGALSLKAAFGLLLGLLVLALLLVLQLNLAAFYASLVGLGLAALYPLTKRFFPVPQLFLGLAFAWPVPMAFVATGAPLDTLFAKLFMLALLMPLAYDTFYALADLPDDAHLPIYTSAKTFGKRTKIFILTVEAGMMALMFSLASHVQAPLLYQIGVLGLSLMLVSMHVLNARGVLSDFQCFKLYGWWQGLWVLLLYFSMLSF